MKEYSHAWHNAAQKRLYRHKVSESELVPSSRPSAYSKEASLAHLHRTAGNRAIGQYLQAKLMVSTPGDQYEQEADRIAEQVTRNPQKTLISGGKETLSPPLVQRKVSGSSAGISEAPPSVHAALSSPGQPLPPALQEEMGQRLGHDFSSVRVHTGTVAERSTQALNAHAYTVGHNIVLAMRQGSFTTAQERQLITHELTHVVQQSGGGDPDSSRYAPISAAPASVQRKCQSELGKPELECTPSSEGVGGTEFLFKMGCDELLPGEDAKVSKLRYGRKLRIHGFASQEGDPDFNQNLSCHRANVIADLVAKQRPDCPIIGRYQHGASPSTTAAKTDPNPRAFWRSVIIEEIRPTREEWLDPTSVLSKGWMLYRKASNSHSTVDLDAASAHRSNIKAWLENVSRSIAPPGKDLDRTDLTNFTQLNSSAEFLWQSIDKLLAEQGHSGAKTDTYVQWMLGSGTDSGSDLHAKHVPKGALYHIDLFGEGFFPGAVNIGMADRTSTTGVSGTRVPNHIYRKFSATDATKNRLPIEDHIVDLVTSENGPLHVAGLINEIARIVAPGGTIVLYGPDNMERYHDDVAKAVKGSIRKEIKNGAIESIITVPIR